MEQKAKSKMIKAGTVWEKKDQSGFFVRLGNESKNPQYDFHVEITVKDGNGNVIAQQTDGLLSLQDPHTSPYANQDALAKVPNLRFEILVPRK